MTINITHRSNFMKNTVILISYYHSALGRHKGRLAKCIYETPPMVYNHSNSCLQKLQSQGVGLGQPHSQALPHTMDEMLGGADPGTPL